MLDFETTNPLAQVCIQRTSSSVRGGITTNIALWRKSGKGTQYLKENRPFTMCNIEMWWKVSMIVPKSPGMFQCTFQDRPESEALKL